MGRPTAVPPTCGRPCWTRQSLVIRCLLLPCARILSRGKSLLGLRAGRADREPTFMRRDRSLLLPPQPQGRLPNYFVKIHKPVLRLPSVVYSIYRLPSILPSVVRVCLPRSAVCRPPSLFVYSLPHSLTVCPPRQAYEVSNYCRNLARWGGQPLYRRPAVGLAGPGRAW